MNNQKLSERVSRLMPAGIPRYIRCYDNGGETLDRYTIVYTGHYKKNGRYFEDLTCSEDPFHGIGQHGESPEYIDRPKSSHLGKKINFTDLPEAVKRAVISDYKQNWELNPPSHAKEEKSKEIANKG